MKVIMTGGGTGGHIYPAIAIADKILEKTSGSEILFVGTRKGLESKLVPRHGYNIEYITVSGMNRKNLLKNIKVFSDYNKGKKQAEAIINEFAPDIVIGTGGYVSGPVLKVASKMGIPCYLQEQNAIPGLTNKMLEKNVDNIFLGFEEAEKYFKSKEKCIVTGNPVRPEFFHSDKEKAREELEIKNDDFMLLAFGGSQGAGRLNKAMIDVIRKYNGVEGVQVYFATGKSYHLPVMTELEELEIALKDNIHVMEYIDEMHRYLAAADLVVSRSGALTVSEIALCEKPSILIPSPNVAGDHQTFNARAISDKGGAVLLKERELAEDVLFDEVERLRNNPKLMEGMSLQAGRCAPVDAADIIYYSIIT
ncbi:MAG: undecaprenyldiphospho-muramoylpentapeptide beta-N-acetylglucosaminyltransferase [Anaerovoracaceae bacterium]|jgi:UDP-N-acetylglucosamine--N-acetylmuramyl-(pentapeptide) pyrophosphoryl-undecaprenol N-acetylglucosamine transferase